jgi:hypothetical protein
MSKSKAAEKHELICRFPLHVWKMVEVMAEKEIISFNMAIRRCVESHYQKDYANDK